MDTTFQVGDKVWLRTRELADGAEIGKLRPRWDGPFSDASSPWRLPLQRLHPRLTRQAALQPHGQRRTPQALPCAGRRAGPGWPVEDPGQEGEYVVEQLINRQDIGGKRYYLVQRTATRIDS